MPQPSPYRLFDVFNSAYRLAALRAAIEIDLFTAIGEGSTTVEQLAPTLQAAQKGTRILCDTIAAMGFLRKREGIYSLTEESAAYLDRRSLYYLGDLGLMSMHSAAWPHLDKPSEAVRTGGAVSDEGDMNQELPDWPDFARAIAPMASFATRAILTASSGANRSAPGAGIVRMWISIPS